MYKEIKFDCKRMQIISSAAKRIKAKKLLKQKIFSCHVTRVKTE